MPAIERVEIVMVELAPEVGPGDAGPASAGRETPILRLHDRDGASGTGYSHALGPGGSAAVRLLHDHLAPMLVGRDADMIEDIWRTLLLATRATSPGAITALALAAIDVALWDLRCVRARQPLYVLAGGAQEKVPAHAGEGGGRHLAADELAEWAIAAKERGLKGARLAVGRPEVAEDAACLAAVREAVGSDFALMADAGQELMPDAALRRVQAFDGLDLAWLEEPLPADDVQGHARLAALSPVPIAAGGALHGLGQFRHYLAAGACAVVRVDAARVGGITPWLKVAHLAEAFSLPVAPRDAMELHVSLAAAVPNGRWIEHASRLDEIAPSAVTLHEGSALPPEEPGLGIEWNWEAIERRRVGGTTLVVD